MRYIKNFKEFLILEKKNIYQWSAFFNNILKDIVDVKKKEKVEQLLVKDIFNNANIIIDNDDKKEYSQSPTEKKFIFLMQQKYNGYMIGAYAGNLTEIKDAVIGSDKDISNIKTFKQLIEFAETWHESLERSHNIVRTDEGQGTDKFIVYPDGWYWINLNTSFSEDEKKNMGHCGSDPGKILFSLRDDEKQSHITVSYSVEKKSVFQIKGRKNTKPKSIYHHNIVDLLLNEKYPINYISTGYYKPELDFSVNDLSQKERDALYDAKPSLKMTDAMFENYFNNNDISSVISMCSNGYVYSDYKIEKFKNIDTILDIINEHKIKDEKIIKNIIESCCSLVYDNMKNWSVENLIYLKKLNVAYEDNILSTTNIIKDDIGKLVKYLGFVPNPDVILSFIDRGKNDILETIVSYTGKIKFTFLYYCYIISSDNKLSPESLPDIFDFSEYNIGLNSIVTKYLDTERFYLINKVVIENCTYTDKFIVDSIFGFLTYGRINEKVIKAFSLFAELLGVDKDIYKKYIDYCEQDKNIFLSEIANCSYLFYVSNIIDIKYMFEIISTMVTHYRYEVVSAVINQCEIKDDDISEYLELCDDIVYVMGILTGCIITNRKKAYDILSINKKELIKKEFDKSPDLKVEFEYLYDYI